MPTEPEQIIPVGSVVEALWWWSTPDKYAGPARFDTLEEARAYDRTGVITIEARLGTPDGRTVRVVGGVSSVDSLFRVSPRQQEGVLPRPGAVVVDLVERDRSRSRYGAPQPPSEQSRIEDAYGEIVLRGPDGGRFVLLPLTTHPAQL